MIKIMCSLTTALLLFHHPRVFQWKEKLLFVLAYGLTAMLIPGGLLNQLPPNPLFWISLSFYGYVLLGVCILLCYSRLQEHGE